ncbi:MAG TPA: hypothetical protein VER11_15980 [Polyangiaceae bacterium]|nr:hypothetical protein [Polyangiaceae bacterium]
MSYLGCRQISARVALAFLLLSLTQCSGKSEPSPSDEGGGASAAAAGGGADMVAGGGSGAETAGSSGSGSVSGSAGQGTAECGEARSTPVGRPQALACPATGGEDIGDAGAGPIACQVDTDCPNAGSCLHGVCSDDRCLVDADCPSGSACRCGEQLIGNVDRRNTCVTVQCRVDSDCGDNGVCSPSFNGYCGNLLGYYCRSSADTCNSDADCCDPDTVCEYQATLGHFACQAYVVCAG